MSRAAALIKWYCVRRSDTLSSCILCDLSRAAVPPKAFAAWQWYNHLCSEIPSEKKVLRVNLDETAICVFQGDVKGNVLVARKTMSAVQHVSHGVRRRFLTHVALVCDDPLIQQVLPQFVIGNAHTIPARLIGTLRSRCPPNFHLLRERSAWVNIRIICQIVRALAAALAPHSAAVQPILCFDACKAHVASPVFTACAAAKLWPLVVPARMTWLLQPLDTHVFSVYKASLHKEFQATRVRQVDGRVGLGDLLTCVYVATHQVLEARPWSRAFESDGFSATQPCVSDRVKQALDVSGPLAIPASRPSLEQLRVCFPANARIPVAPLWRAVDASPPSASSASAAPPLRRSARIAAAAAHSAAGRGVPVTAGGEAARLAAPSGIITRSRSRAMGGMPAGRA